MAQCLAHSKGSVSGLANTFLLHKKGLRIPSVVAYTLNPSTWEAEAGGSL